jgi:hypothetical protein
MKQVTVTETVFLLGELSDTAREKALEKMRMVLYDNIDSSQITDHLNGELYSALTGTYDGEISKKELSKRVGLTIEWSLSHCQGDGVAIYGTLYKDDAPNVNWHGADTATFTRNSHGHHYSHENCMTIALFTADDDGCSIDADTDTTEKFAEQFRNLCRELARSGYDEIENLTSEQAVLDHLEWSEPRRFTIDGDIYPTKWWGE